ncbi:MAG: bifunctional riboflavin kinase/FAD synthetase [Bacteroidales bacterium]|nr:bifunctional riboflavin kinase/FAD synthetase [Bacteroidales bacterium]MBQ6957523.1 bifunctional riboflavin kinase/FAD synthetase [Bacteroidales bacterium]
MAVAATGFFDGVHLGHRQVIDQLCAIARQRGEESLIVTFWPHPRSVLQQDADRLRLLTSLQEKRERCLSYGVDRFEVLPFTRAFSTLSAEAFVRDYLVDRFGVTTLILGYDHRLGHDRFESPQQMMDMVARCGVQPVRVEAFTAGSGAVSSTQIRTALYAGDVASATQMLGYRYSLCGVVVTGDKLGRTLGFPTANMLLYEPLKLVPGNGVYAVWVDVLGRRCKGVCNIGTRPTVGLGHARRIETHILDFDEDIYGLDLRIEFCARLRDEQRFDSLDALTHQLHRDCRKAAEIIVA